MSGAGAGTVELPSEGYTVAWSAPASADESASIGMPSPGGGGGPTPPQLQIELNILYGNDRGRRLVLGAFVRPASHVAPDKHLSCSWMNE